MPISEELATSLDKIKCDSGTVFKTYYRESFTRVKLSRAVNEFRTKGLRLPLSHFLWTQQVLPAVV